MNCTRGHPLTKNRAIPSTLTSLPHPHTSIVTVEGKNRGRPSNRKGVMILPALFRWLLLWLRYYPLDLAGTLGGIRGSGLCRHHPQGLHLSVSSDRAPAYSTHGTETWARVIALRACVVRVARGHSTSPCALPCVWSAGSCSPAHAPYLQGFGDRGGPTSHRQIM